MAERRMFAKTIVTSDAFLDMPLSARCLYFSLGMLADDDGFVNSPKSVMRQVGATLDDIRILISKKFIIEFEDGVIAIKHWRINNFLRRDRHNETKYKDHAAEIKVDENGSYTLNGDGTPLVDIWLTNGTPSDDQRSTEVSVGKDSIGEDSVDKDNDITTIPSSSPFLPSRESASTTPPHFLEVFRYLREELKVENWATEGDRFFKYNEKRGWDCLPNWKEAASRWVDRIDEHRGERKDG